MKTGLITFRGDEHVVRVIDRLIKERISGAPVVDEEHRLLGMISEMDCLRALMSGAYDGERLQPQLYVRDLMTTECITVEKQTNIFKMVELFDKHSIRRLPVLEDGIVIGQVSRRDILVHSKHLLE